MLELEGGLVDQALEQRGRLRPAGAAVGAHRRGVRDRHGDVELDRRERVHAVRHPLGAGREERADARIGAGVAEQPHPQAGERAVGVGRRARRTAPGRDCAAALTRSSLRVGDHVTGRPSGARRAGDRRVLGADAGLAAEPAADLRRDDADVVASMPSAPASWSARPWGIWVEA